MYVCICMYICVYVCIYIYIYICIRTNPQCCCFCVFVQTCPNLFILRLSRFTEESGTSFGFRLHWLLMVSSICFLPPARVKQTGIYTYTCWIYIYIYIYIYMMLIQLLPAKVDTSKGKRPCEIFMRNLLGWLETRLAINTSDYSQLA